MEPGGKLHPSKISIIMSASSSSFPPSILTTAIHVSTPPPARLLMKHWSATQTQKGLFLSKMSCSVGQAIHFRLAGSKEVARFWLDNFPPFCTLDSTKHVFIPSGWAENEPNGFSPSPPSHPKFGTAEVSIALFFSSDSLEALHCAYACGIPKSCPLPPLLLLPSPSSFTLLSSADRKSTRTPPSSQVDLSSTSMR